MQFNLVRFHARNIARDYMPSNNLLTGNRRCEIFRLLATINTVKRKAKQVKGKTPTIKMTDDQIRGLLGGLQKTIDKILPVAQKQFEAAHKAGNCNCNDVRRLIGDALLPKILKLNSGTAAEFLAMMLANVIFEDMQAQMHRQQMAGHLKDLLGKLAQMKNNPPPVEGDEWKNNE